MPRLLACPCAIALVLAVACGGAGGEDIESTPDATSTPAAAHTATVEDSRTPANSGLLDDVIELAVQLDTMTREQAVCVFQDHPSIFNAFLQSSGLDQSTTIIQS